MAYVGQFLAIRSGDWDLRLASVKAMAPVFTAFDHQTYQKLISMHLDDLLSMPPEIRAMFKQGAFVVSICGRPWHSVAIDECHEMMINKDCKMSIVRPLPDSISRIVNYMAYRSRTMENLRQQVLHQEEDKKKSAIISPFSSKPNDAKCELNICEQMKRIEKSGIFEITPDNRGLFSIGERQARESQQNDLLNFRSIGEREFKQRPY